MQFRPSFARGGAVQDSNGFASAMFTNKKTGAQGSASFIGGRYRTRTCDLLHVKQMLYQLS